MSPDPAGRQRRAPIVAAACAADRATTAMSASSSASCAESSTTPRRLRPHRARAGVRHRPVVSPPRAGGPASARAQVLDVGIGTGLVAREALALIGAGGRLVGVDPSAGMMSEVRCPASSWCAAGPKRCRARTPAATSSAWATRCATSPTWARPSPSSTACCARAAGCWCWRSPSPPGRIGTALLKGYMRAVVPLIARVVARRRDTAELWRYYWDTIEACIPPESVMAALRAAGFADVRAPRRAGHVLRIHRDANAPDRCIRARAHQTSTAAESCDVLVIGGGPAGSTIAALLADAGPRRGAAREGAPPALSHRRIAAARQRARCSTGSACASRSSASACRSTASSSSRPTTSTAATSSSPRPGTRSMPYAWQVRRSEFDEMLFRHAAAQRRAHVRRLPRARRRASTPTAPTVQVELDDGAAAQLARAVRRRRLGPRHASSPTSSSASRRTRSTTARRSSATSPARERLPGKQRRQHHASSGSRTAGSGSFRWPTAPPASARCAGRTT